MKVSKKLSFTLLLLYLFFLNWVQGQSIGFNQLPDTSYQFEISNLPDFGYNTDTAHYKVFFAYGDGNYRTFESEMFPGRTYNSIAHNYMEYKIGYSYVSTPLFFERKTEEPPPPLTQLPDSVLLSVPKGIINPIDPISNEAEIIDYSGDTDFCRRIGLDHSHFLESEKWSSFILGYRPDTMGVLLFFYDDNSNVGIQFDSTKSEGSRYGEYRSRETEVFKTDASIFANTNIDKDKLNFESVLIYPIPQIEPFLDDTLDNASTPEELRFFHFLHSTILDEDSNHNFMAVIAQIGDPATMGNLKSCVDNNWAEDSTFAKNYVNEAGDLLKLNFENITTDGDTINYYYIDAVQLSKDEGDPKDPNLVEIINVKSIGNDEHLVSFHLSFCNVNPVPTESATIYLNDLENILYDFQFQETGSNVKNDTVNCPQDVTKCDFTFIKNESDKSFCVMDYTVVGSIVDFPYEDDRSKKCREVYFTAVVHDDDKWILYETPVVQACINFHETHCELVCSKNTFAEKTIKGEEGGCSRNNILMSLGVLLFIGILIPFIFGRRHKHSHSHGSGHEHSHSHDHDDHNHDHDHS